MIAGLAPALLGVTAMPVIAAPPAAITSPAEIDRALIGFTGAAIGSPGGARVPTDPRLRLAACEGPLLLDWHTEARSSVRIACPGPAPWRIFAAIAPASPASAVGNAAPAIKRGDTVLIAVRGRGFSVQRPGEAVEGGQVGDWIFVRTAPKAEPLRARIERPGLVVIPAS